MTTLTNHIWHEKTGNPLIDWAVFGVGVLTLSIAIFFSFAIG